MRHFNIDASQLHIFKTENQNKVKSYMYVEYGATPCQAFTKSRQENSQLWAYNSIVIFSARLKLHGQMSWFLYYQYWAMLHINTFLEDQEMIFETVFIYLYIVYTNKKWYLRQYLFTFILCIQMLPWHASIYCFKSLSWKNNNNNRKSH